METFTCANMLTLTAKFKSYYVVWKRPNSYGKNNTNSVFKSYYVVWKLHMTENKNITQAKFKSYYVVWKRLSSCFFCVASACLNRTM